MNTHLDVVKGEQHGTTYYTGSLSYAMADKWILSPSHDHFNDIFGGAEEAQRKLNEQRLSGKNGLVSYITEASNPFFSSLTLVMVPMGGGSLKEGEDYKFVPIEKGSNIGRLFLDDAVIAFPADGQHRSEAIQRSLLIDKLLRKEQVPVVLIPFESKEKVRQTFSDLNLHPKVVSKTIGYAFDSRSALVIITKRVMNDVWLFLNRVNKRTNALSLSSLDVITVNALVESHKVLLDEFLDRGILTASEFAQAQDADPMAMHVGKLAQPFVQVWNLIIGALDIWSGVMASPPTVTPGEVREGALDDERPKGEKGHVAAYGLGWQALARIAAALFHDRPNTWEEDLVTVIKAVNWEKGSHWQGIAMVGDRVNNTGPGIRNTAGYALKTAGFTEGVRIKPLVDSLTPLDLDEEFDPAA